MQQKRTSENGEKEYLSLVLEDFPVYEAGKYAISNR